AFEQAPRQVEGLLLHFDAAPGDFEASTRVADVGIGPDGFGHDRDPGEVVGSLYRLDIGAARFHRATEAAEEVDLVPDVQAGIVHLTVGQAGVRAERGSRLPAIA